VNNQNLRVKTTSFVLVTTATAGVCVCRGVAALDVCVTHEGYSSELWRFSTSTRVWDRVDTPATNRPSARGGHTMTSVGLNLWVFGGETRGVKGGSGELCTPRTVLCGS
jgi:hypothetical protein